MTFRSHLSLRARLLRIAAGVIVVSLALASGWAVFDRPAAAAAAFTLGAYFLCTGILGICLIVQLLSGDQSES